MELRRILTILMRRWWLVLGVPAVVLVVSLLLQSQSPWVASFRVSVIIPGDTSDPGSAERPELMVLDDVPELITSPVFANRVTTALAEIDPTIVLTPDQIQTSFSADYYGRIVTVRSTRPDERGALALAEAARLVLDEQINFALVAEGDPPATVRLIQPTTASRDSPATTGIALLVSTLVALAIGCGLAALAAALDGRLRDRTDVTAVYDGVVLGDVRTGRAGRGLPAIPRRVTPNPARTGEASELPEPHSPARDEPVRALRAVVDAAVPVSEGSVRAVLLAGLDLPARDVATRLGTAFAAASHRTLVIDTTSLPSDEPDTSMTAWLSANIGDPPVFDAAGDLAIVHLAAPAAGVDIMRADRWAELLQAQAPQWSTILIVVRPLASSADALALARVVTTTILIVTAGRSDGSGLLQGRAAIESAGGMVAGVVIA
ncbi:MAG TPA: hypothetical protein VGT61_15095 [Thermomicrobiales bacterium]|jgi:capsular polysaccharide biosynthesis protein|nr:hypothetical protein [Thermomicrobiales bacterium]